MPVDTKTFVQALALRSRFDASECLACGSTYRVARRSSLCAECRASTGAQ